MRKKSLSVRIGPTSRTRRTIAYGLSVFNEPSGRSRLCSEPLHSSRGYARELNPSVKLREAYGISVARSVAKATDLEAVHIQVASHRRYARLEQYLAQHRLDISQWNVDLRSVSVLTIDWALSSYARDALAIEGYGSLLWLCYTVSCL